MNNDTQADAIKPCPFCGTTEHLSVSPCGSMTADMPARPHRVVCFHIDHDEVGGPVGYGREAAIAAWNTRTSSLAAQDEGLISDKSRIERLRRLVHRWIGQGQVLGIVHDMDLQCEIDDAIAWANQNEIPAPEFSLAAQDGLVDALRASETALDEAWALLGDLREDVPVSVIEALAATRAALASIEVKSS